MVETVLSVVLAIITTAFVVALALLVMKMCESCNHYYERIDTCNDKKMIFVCCRCGKIKKLRK
jgi:hypothetical protein